MVMRSPVVILFATVGPRLHQTLPEGLHPLEQFGLQEGGEVVLPFPVGKARRWGNVRVRWLGFGPLFEGGEGDSWGHVAFAQSRIHRHIHQLSLAALAPRLGIWLTQLRCHLLRHSRARGPRQGNTRRRASSSRLRIYNYFQLMTIF